MGDALWLLPIRACVAELAAGPDSNLIEIIRAVASSCATLTSYLSLPGSLVLRAEEHSLDPIATARRIADHLQLPSADEDILAYSILFRRLTLTQS